MLSKTKRLSYIHDFKEEDLQSKFQLRKYIKLCSNKIGSQAAIIKNLKRKNRKTFAKNKFERRLNRSFEK